MLEKLKEFPNKNILHKAFIFFWAKFSKKFLRFRNLIKKFFPKKSKNLTFSGNFLLVLSHHLSQNFLIFFFSPCNQK